MKWNHESTWDELKDNLGGGKTLLSMIPTNNNLDYDK